MYYYSVWVRSSRYHGSEPLTYSSDQRLKAGQIVLVPLQRQSVLGVISAITTAPRFKIKPIERVYDLPPIPNYSLRLFNWLQAYYPAPLGMLAQQLLPASFSDRQLENFTKAKLKKPSLDGLPKLTPEQQQTLEQMTETETYLLHGTTGSGKTRLYIEMAAQAIQAGKSAIILTPEISLTTQLSNSFKAVFGERVVVLHSQQRPAERQAAWLRCLRAIEPLVVIGPRSALFTPLLRPGLIVLDEAHEAAYKQEQAPQYQAGRVAAYLAQITRSTLILGTATPSVSDYYLAKNKQKPILELKQLAQRDLIANTKISIIDRRDHSLFDRSPYLSRELIKSIQASLKRGEQSLLYLNRRGTARLVLCESCGWQAACPHCDLPLTYHGDKHLLRCHSCDHRQPAPAACPNCHHPDIIFKTAGTKAIVADVERLFPGAKIARFDTDNARSERLEQHYDSIKNGEIDILVGTQLLAKGLDLPKLSTLGVLLADTSLYLPDFSASERTFQLISQVLGRIGRGHVPGRAIIQTYHPDHPVIRAAIEGDYDGFYQAEIKERQNYRFPPFCYLLKLSVRRATIRGAETAAQNLKNDILTSGYKVQIEGPAPSFYERFQNKYQWQLVIKAADRGELLKVVANLPANTHYDLDPQDLL